MNKISFFENIYKHCFVNNDMKEVDGFRFVISSVWNSKKDLNNHFSLSLMSKECSNSLVTSNSPLFEGGGL